MARTSIWKSISDALTSEITNGHYKPGDQLPTEAALASRFNVNRHTVRRAIREMNETGLVHSRRGAGVFVASNPTDYRIGKRVRFAQNITGGGQNAEREILARETRASNPREADALCLEHGATVHVVETRSFVDCAPVSLSRHVFPARRFPKILEAFEDTTSITTALLSQGISDYTRASTRLTAKRASAIQAQGLHIREGDPILRTININVAPGDGAIEYGHTWFAGDRITLVVEDG